MIRARVLVAVFLAARPLAAAAAAADAGPAGAPQSAQEDLTPTQYVRGLDGLRRHLETRGEDGSSAELFISDLESPFQDPSARRVPVTRAAFEDFLKYEAAWARKARDAKNPSITPSELEHEVQRAAQLKAEFQKEAKASSPRFYRAFHAAVKDVRTARGGGQPYAGGSAAFFGDQVDDSYSHVDAGDEALDQGDAAGAAAQANAALAENPANADALVLRSGAEYSQGDYAAAVKDAASALQLDPGNPQAQAIVSLSPSAAAASPASAPALTDAAAMGSSLADDGRTGASAPPAPAPAVSIRPGPPSPTPAVGALLSMDLTSRAVDTAGADAHASISQLDQALRLNPRNSSAQGWRASISNRLGDYSAGMASAEAGLLGDPRDPVALFNKAYASAGAGDRDGMIDALAAAARVDPGYESLLDKVKALGPTDDATEVFRSAAPAHQPAPPRSRRRRYPRLLLIAAGIGALLTLGGAAQLFRKGA